MQMHMPIENWKLQINNHLKLIFKKRNKGRWLIYGTKHSKDNQLQSLELPC